MSRRMQQIFKVGLTIVILISVFMFYVIHWNWRNNAHPSDNEAGGRARAAPHGAAESSLENAGHDDSKLDGSQFLKTGGSQHQPFEDVKQMNARESVKHSENAPSLAEDGKKLSDRESPMKAPEVDVKGPDTIRSSHSISSITQDSRLNSGSGKVESEQNIKKEDTIHLGVVICGEDRFAETNNLLKSARIFSTRRMHFHIFAEDDLFPKFQAQLALWPQRIKDITTYSLHRIEFPNTKTANTGDWRTLFKPCASQRLFIPELLKDVDSILYVDTDILFLDSIDHIWGYFKEFNSTQIAALSPEHEDAHAGWYNRFARHPYYGKLGVNSGVMLMNLTRIREQLWLQKIIEYFKEYRLKITWGDQDLINIYFHYHPDQLFIYPCEWNYRSDHCMYMSVCKTAETNGVYVLHGNRRVFHNNKEIAFKAVYDAFNEFQYGNDIESQLLRKMEENMKGTSHTNCGRIGHIYTRRIAQCVKAMTSDNAQSKNTL